MLHARTCEVFGIDVPVIQGRSAGHVCRGARAPCRIGRACDR
jgi:hypothetical protein